MILSAPASLRARMTWLFTVGFSAFVLVAGATIWLWSWQTAQQHNDTLTRDAVSLMRREWEGGGPALPVRARAALDELNEDPRFLPVAAFILDATGRVLASSHAPAHAAPDALKGEWSLLRQSSQNHDAIFVAAVDTQPAQQSARQQGILLGILGLLAICAASRAAWILVGRTLQPIDLLSGQAAQIAKTASDAPSAPIQMTAPSNDAEVRHLVQTLNALLARVHDTATRRQQWYAAAAHELRTPLAVLSGTMEVALSRSRTNAEYEETLQSLQTQTRRLIALSEGVLLLSRLDAGAEGEPSVPVSLPDACRQILDALGPLAEARRLDVQFEINDAALVCAPHSHVAILTRNLIENAVKYAPDGGQISLTVSGGHGNSGAELRIFNTHDIARKPINFARIWEPFYRENYVRSAGSGLGLAICARLAETNGWYLEMTSAPGGVCVIARFSSVPDTTPI